jgi:transcriptional regulator with XRE-family HTH domain
MSDLYLILRSRLDAVAEWVLIDAPILKAARDARGLSYESVARELHVSSKTWERYEKRGRIPRHLLGSVASLLDLEIEQPAPRRVRVGTPELGIPALDDLRDHLDRRLDAIELQLAFIARRAGLDLAEAIRAATRAVEETEHLAARLMPEEQPQREQEPG